MLSRSSLFIVVLLFSALIFSACGQASPTPTSTQPRPTATHFSASATLKTATPTSAPTLDIEPAALRGVTVKVWHAFSGPAYDVFSRQAAQFSANNEWGVTIVATGFGDYTSLFDAVTTGLDSGNSPDLVAALPDQALAWDASASVVDLTPYTLDPAWGLTDDATADIPASLWAQDHVDGRLLGLPAQRSARYLFYNRTWAAELGFAEPPTSTDDFRRQACAANAAFLKDTNPTNDGYGGWIVDSHWQTAYSWLLAFDGGVALENGYGFRTDPNLAALQYLKKLYDDHCAWLSTELLPFNSFARRSALFISADLSELPLAANSMTRLNNTDQWELIPFPGPDRQIVVTYGPSYTVMKSTGEKQVAAWLFARWMLSPENQSQWIDATGLLPLRTSVLPTVGQFRQATPQWDAAVEHLQFAEGVPQLGSWRKVRYVLEDGLNTIFQTNLPIAQFPSILMEMDTLAAEMHDK